MGKHEPGTPKFIANKMKAKGLQKLRWYCQMCQKQCRDENGFKCHTMSESHQRNLLMFADNSKKYMDEFSKDFLDGFTDLLRRQFGTKRVAANKVYQDYIADREHIHMNSTRWVTLTGFVKWLGRTGKAVVDETEKGWFIQYIDRDPETLAKQERKSKKQKMDKDDEEKLLEFVEKQVQLGQMQPNDDDSTAPSELVRKDADEKISLQLNLQPLKSAPVLLKPEEGVFQKPMPPKSLSLKRKLPDGDPKLIEQLESTAKTKQKCWLAKGIVVKIVTSELGPKFYKQKSIVETIEDDYRAVVRTIDTNHRIKLDQNDLKTVVPKPGHLVLIVQGEHRLKTAVLRRVFWDAFEAEVEVKPPHSKGEGFKINLHYDNFSKLWVKS